MFQFIIDRKVKDPGSPGPTNIQRLARLVEKMDRPDLMTDDARVNFLRGQGHQFGLWLAQSADHEFLIGLEAALNGRDYPKWEWDPGALIDEEE